MVYIQFERTYIPFDVKARNSQRRPVALTSLDLSHKFETRRLTKYVYNQKQIKSNRRVSVCFRRSNAFNELRVGRIRLRQHIRYGELIPNQSLYNELYIPT